MKMTKLRWWIIGLVCVGTIVNYLSRSSLSVAAPAMMKELHFDEQQYSWVVSAFQLCYTIAQPITGYLMDVIGLKIGFFNLCLVVVADQHGARAGRRLDKPGISAWSDGANRSVSDSGRD